MSDSSDTDSLRLALISGEPVAGALNGGCKYMPGTSQPMARAPSGFEPPLVV